MKNLYKIKNDLYIIDNNEKVTQNGIWAKCSFTGDILKNRNGQHAYKVILTTNDSLINDGVQAINNDFLEWFVKNPSCEEVEVNKLCYGALSGFADAGYKIIIPKEEPKQDWYCPKCDSYVSSESVTFEETHQLCNTSVIILEPKQETLEKVAERMVKNHPDFEAEGMSEYQNGRFNGIIEGAEWQQERSYSEEEVKEILFHRETEYLKTKSVLHINEWFEQFKKK